MHSDLFRSRSRTLLVLVYALIAIVSTHAWAAADQGGPASSVTTVVEYYHEAFDHYFITADPGEIAKLDDGTIAGWTRSGLMFNAYPRASAGAASVCRFFSTAFTPKSSHFYTPSPAECATVKANPSWQFEGDGDQVFYIPVGAGDGSCAAGTSPVYRLFNNGQGGAPNHRYTTDGNARAQMISKGWALEGNGPGFAFMCAPPPAPGPTPSPPPSGGMTFAERCAQPGVVKCVGFDSPADFGSGSGGTNGAYGFNSGILPPWDTADYTRATLDSAVKASGNGSLKFTIPSKSPADSSGSYFTNFSADLSVQFGENAEFYIQWRQRFSPELLDTKFAGGGGWKQLVVGTGDQPGQLYASCTALEVVVQNTYQRGFPQLYNSCTGSASHGPYDGFEERFGNDIKMQNGRLSPYCLYSQGASSTYFPPNGNCFGYVANEWLTFQVRIKTGPRVGNEFRNSYVTMWIAREGQASELVFDWGPYNLSAGDPAENQRFGKVWLLPYHTGKDASVSNPIAYTWYDELVISRNKIADP